MHAQDSTKVLIQQNLNEKDLKKISSPLAFVLAAMLALTLVISILTDSPPSPSTASSGSS